MNLEAFAAKLESDGHGLTRATSIFVHSKPADKDGVMLREYFGGTGIDPELPGMRKGPFQLIVTTGNYQQGKALAEAISAKWNTDDPANPKPFVITGITKVNYLRPRSEPFVYPLSPGNRWEFLVNFEACYVL